jgi:uncharacterized protein YuzE
MKLTHDLQADAMYLQLREAEIEKTVEVSSRVFVDLDSTGDPVGIELLFVSHWLTTPEPGVTFSLLSPGPNELIWRQLEKI